MSAGDLENFLQEGDAEESHHIDFKREISNKRDRRGVAEHLASFSTDGGWLVIGVDEPSSGEFVPAPLRIAGEAERIESIAHSRVDPLLHIEATSLDKGDGTGYLIVRVPPSPHVVHAVDHAYWGRGDKKKVLLADAEVDRRIRMRHARTDQIVEDVRLRLAAYPSVAKVQGSRTQMMARAVPRTPHPRPLWRLTNPSNSDAISAAISSAENWFARWFREGSRSEADRPWITRALRSHFPRPYGRGVVSEGITAESGLYGVEVDTPLAEVRIHETGILEVWWDKPPGNPSDVFRGDAASDDDVFEAAAVAVALSGVIAEEWSFDGLWDFGIYIVNPDRIVAKTDRRAPHDPKSYPGREPYKAATSFTTLQVTAAPEGPLREVVGSFFRSLHTYGRFFNE